jgi:hypothetical protein
MPVMRDGDSRLLNVVDRHGRILARETAPAGRRHLRPRERLR